MIDLSQLPWLLALDLIVAAGLCGHILLTKDNEAAAFAWISVVVLVPFLGAVFYVIFGINRVERRARKLRHRPPRFMPVTLTSQTSADADTIERRIVAATGAVQTLPLTTGNTVRCLVDGDEAFPTMLSAINRAQRSVALSTYIFDHDKAGEMFADALAAARNRGVAVRILIDDMGLRYSASAIDTLLMKRGLPTARFLPTKFRLIRFMNLRNHRKILVVDGQEAFIGGMNIRHGHMLAERPKYPVRDLHFQIVGPVIDQLSDVFAEDWGFATGEDVDLPAWVPAAPSTGGAVARVVPDGPDHHFEKLQWVIGCALGAARTRVRIMTPYFLPNQFLAGALMVAALRGIDVEVIVPSRTNLPFIGWAMASHFQRLLEHRVKIFLSPPPFDHSKVLLVDDSWCLVGSTNWDQRSLRLNFEANIEVVDADLAGRLNGIFNARKAQSQIVELAAVQRAPMIIRLRNNFVRLFSPYL